MQLAIQFMSIHLVDVKSAYLNANIDWKIYIE